MNCENCAKEAEELVSRQGFCMSFFVEWVCKECFKDLEKVDFEEYGSNNYYRREDVQT